MYIAFLSQSLNKKYVLQQVFMKQDLVSPFKSLNLM